VAVAAAVATLRFIKKHKLWDHAATLGEEVFLPRLKELEAESKFIGDTRGKGLMIGIEFVKDKKSKKPWPEFVEEVQKACYQKGLITETGGHFSNVIRFLPPIVLTRELAEVGIEIFAESVKEVEAAM
jgi:diaminobutyrate-2-oxoglutarate transaminase